jgi:hypothetical protein
MINGARQPTQVAPRDKGKWFPISERGGAPRSPARNRLRGVEGRETRFQVPQTLSKSFWFRSIDACIAWKRAPRLGPLQEFPAPEDREWTLSTLPLSPAAWRMPRAR